jgi:hypothetical protein
MQADAAGGVEQLRLRVLGPPEPQWVTTTPQDTKLLREALAVAEFVTVMQPVLLSEPVVLPMLLAAVQRPADSQELPALYIVLLRSCLLEMVHLEAPCTHHPAALLHA